MAGQSQYTLVYLLSSLFNIKAELYLHLPKIHIYIQLKTIPACWVKNGRINRFNCIYIL